MPIYHLKLKCELENIEKIAIKSDVLWKFDISSPSGEVRKGITVSPQDEIQLDGSKGTANYVMKWAGSNSQSYIKIVPVKKVDGSYTSADSSKIKTLLGLECRGLEIIKWIPGEDFSGESTGGTKFESIDLTDKEWTDYDEDNDLSVSIMNLVYEIVKE